MDREHRDLVIEALADSEAALIEHVVALESERDSFRDLAHAAAGQLHDLTLQQRRLRAAHHRLLDEYRCLRAKLLSETQAA